VPFDELVQGVRFNAAHAREVIDGLAPADDVRALLDLGLAIYLTNHLRWLETNYAGPRLVELAEVVDRPITLDVPDAVERLPAALRTLCAAALDDARKRTAARTRQLRGEATNA
jgi:hypothetical protein